MEAFSLGWSAADNPQEALHYWDYTSLYPSVASDEGNLYPTGKPTILIQKEEIDRLSFKDDMTYYEMHDGKTVRVEGIAQLTILPPRDLTIPYLQYRYALL